MAATDVSPRRAAGQLNGRNRASTESGSSAVYHTLTACTRCRSRKSKCDVSLPRCGPCEHAGAQCKYWDAARGKAISRNYIVQLQDKIKSLEAQLGDADVDDAHDQDPEALMRDAATVRVREGDESKFLGPSSGIAMTRLVMRLAKQTTGSKSIRDIISDASAMQVKDRFAQEGQKPTSKIYPLVSSLPASELPSHGITDLLVNLFNLKVQSMYPILHEPTLAKHVLDVYDGSTDPYENFVVRMIIAIGMQKMDIQWAGLGDSYYLDALQYLEPTIRPMNLKTLQCFALIAIYSTLTPTRTAVYYLVGLAVRLVQALGLDEEAKITKGQNGERADVLEIDMRRRMYWALVTMDFGFAHSLGRPSILATAQDHLNVDFFEPIADEYITPQGFLGGPFSIRKWIAIHFYKMRLLQLEVRRTLYQKKRSEPTSDTDPWFQQMENKLIKWRNASPNNDQGSGFSKVWFTGRYYTIIVFLFRPSPQIPQPSTRAAIACFDACEYEIYMQREQIRTRSVELTWIFTQTLFMGVNTMLWSLAYAEIRSLHPKEEVRKHLDVALEAIQLASERWPGVESALQLYGILIDACLRVYDTDGDVPIAASTPSDNAGLNRSQSSSPTNANRQNQTPDIMTLNYLDTPSRALSSSRHTSPVPYQSSPVSTLSHLSASTPPSTSHAAPVTSINSTSGLTQPFDPTSQFNSLPNTFNDLANWHPLANLSTSANGIPDEFTLFSDSALAINTPPAQYNELLAPQYWPGEELPSRGLDQAQQMELMRALETDGMDGVESMIRETNAIFNIKG